MATNTERAIKSREKAKALGRKRKEYFVTDQEHIKLRDHLKKLREHGCD